MDDRPHRIRVRSNRAREVAGALLAGGAAVGVRLEDENTVVIDTDRGAAVPASVAAAAREADARLLEVVPLDDDLDSVFRYLVGQQ